MSADVMKTILRIFLCAVFSLSVFSAGSQPVSMPKTPDLSKSRFYSDSRPWTRWWWFAAEIRKADIADNLLWLKKNGFGGVEIAWVYPLNRMKKDTIHYTP
ncbi:MAG: hypothetical protein WCG06_04020, partial [Candidatus Omnitrophota bacterium]